MDDIFTVSAIKNGYIVYITVPQTGFVSTDPFDSMFPRGKSYDKGWYCPTQEAVKRYIISRMEEMYTAPKAERTSHD